MNRPENEARSIEAVESAAAEELAETYEELAAAESLLEGGPGEGTEPASEDLELLAELEGVAPPAVIPDAELTSGEAAPFALPFDDEVEFLPEHLRAWAPEDLEETLEADQLV